MEISHLSVEITRRCNLKCRHCCRGDAQNIDIDYKYIDLLLDQINYIDHLTFTGGEPSLNVPAMQYFIDECIRKSVKIRNVSIITNGVKIEQDFIDVCIDIFNMIVDKIDVRVSDDIYHQEQKLYDDSLLKSLPFFAIRSNVKILREGRGRHLKESEAYGAGTMPFTSSSCFNSKKHYITMNVFGEIINGIDWSYDNQMFHYLCRIENLSIAYEYLNQHEMNNRFVEDDWERLSNKDKMYLQEKEREIWEEYQRWIEDQERLPTRIIVKVPKEVKEVVK